MPHYILPSLWQKNSMLQKISPTLKPWILHSGSLTKRLRQHSKKFSLRLIKENWQRPRYDEIKLLKISMRENVWVREVQLLCDDQVCVLARSIFPRKTLRGEGYRLRLMQEKPLIEALATDKLLTRSDFEITRVPIKENSAQCLWQRRSIFYFYKQPVLVTELFLPTIINLIKL